MQSPLPTQYNVENRVNLKVLVFNIVCGGGEWGLGGGGGGEVR